MTTNTNIFKGRDGWEGETRIDLDMTDEKGARLELEITTTKSNNGRIVSRAAVFHIEDRCRSHAFGLGGPGGDFSTQIESTVARCTEKSVRELHARALAGEHGLTARARAHYAGKPTVVDTYTPPAESTMRRPGDAAAAFAEETGVDYSTALRMCNMD